MENETLTPESEIHNPELLKKYLKPIRVRSNSWFHASRPEDIEGIEELPERIKKDCSRCKASLHDYKNPCEHCINGSLFR